VLHKTIPYYRNTSHTIPYSAISYEIPYDTIPYYDDTHYNDTPYDDIPYDISHYDNTPYDKILYDVRSHEAMSCKIYYEISVLATNGNPEQFQESPYQVLMTFFPHYSHPPYYRLST
jgi:hypothetical protein